MEMMPELFYGQLVDSCDRSFLRKRAQLDELGSLKWWNDLLCKHETVRVSIHIFNGAQVEQASTPTVLSTKWSTRVILLVYRFRKKVNTVIAHPAEQNAPNSRPLAYTRCWKPRQKTFKRPYRHLRISSRLIYLVQGKLLKYSTILGTFLFFFFFFYSRLSRR